MRCCCYCIFSLVVASTCCMSRFRVLISRWRSVCMYRIPIFRLVPPECVCPSLLGLWCYYSRGRWNQFVFPCLFLLMNRTNPWYSIIAKYLNGDENTSYSSNVLLLNEWIKVSFGMLYTKVKWNFLIIWPKLLYKKYAYRMNSFLKLSLCIIFPVIVTIVSLRSSWTVCFLYALWSLQRRSDFMKTISPGLNDLWILFLLW